LSKITFKLRPVKLEDFTCGAADITSAIASGDENLVISGCVQYVDKTIIEVDCGDGEGQTPCQAKGALGIKKPREGVTGSCMFTCAEGFRPALKAAVEEEENAERAKKGKKPKKKKKSKKGKGKNH
jgi:hypothetical protein